MVEPLVSEQWFVKMMPLAERALGAVADGTITIMPERFPKIYNGWLENIKVCHQATQLVSYGIWSVSNSFSQYFIYYAYILCHWCGHGAASRAH